MVGAFGREVSRGFFVFLTVLCRPGGDLLSRVLRRSTIGAEEFDDRVRNGIGYGLLAITTKPAKDRENLPVGEGQAGQDIFRSTVLGTDNESDQAKRAISTDKLIHYWTSTLGLSTS